MDYHLARNGQNLGVFSVEELQRRRATGELSGADLVWREGMATWVPLDSILQPAAPSSVPPFVPPAIASTPVPTAKARRKGVLFWVILTGAFVLLVSFVLLAVFVVSFVKGFREAYRSSTTARQGSADLATKPITAATNSFTEKDAKQRARAFRVRQYIDGYRQNGRHDTPCDADATRFLDAWLAWEYGGSTNLSDPHPLADKLVAQPGCNDPLVLTIAAAACNNRAEKARRLQAALDGFDSSRHKAYPKFYAAVTLATDYGRQAARVEALDQTALNYLKQALTDGSFLPDDEPVLAEIFINGWGSGFLERKGEELSTAIKQARGFQWLGLVIEGECHIDLAWKARGSGWADSVTPEGWKGFSDHLSKAHAALNQAWKLHPDRAVAPARMITVAMGESDAADMRTWFDRAIAAQIDYPRAWKDYRWGLRPRWFGSHEALLALGYQAVDTKRFDTDVPRKLFDCISDVESELQEGRGEHIYGRLDIWPHLQEMYEGYIADPSQPDSRNGWRNSYSIVAYLAGQYAVARQQLEALNWKPVNLTGWGSDLSLMPLKIAALTSPCSNQVERAETAYEQLDLEKGRKLFAEIDSSQSADDRTRQFCQARSDALKQELTLARGDWVDLLPADDKDPNWVFFEDKVRHLEDGGLEVSSDQRGHGFYCRTRVGPEFELTGQIEFVRSSTKSSEAGILMGLPDNTGSVWYSFRLYRNDQTNVAILSSGWASQSVIRKTALNDDRNSFQLRVTEGAADAWVNGNQVFHRAFKSSGLRLAEDSFIGLGAPGEYNETVVRYRNIRVRRLIPGSSPSPDKPLLQ
jgi:hypothetical protein